MRARRLADAVVPVVHFAVTVEKLGTVWSVQVLAEHAGPVEDGLQVLEDLHAAWGPDGELAGLSNAPTGVPVPLGWETLLLLGAMMRRPGPPGTVDLDVPHGSASRSGPWRAPTPDEMHAVALDLVAQELQDAGCLAAQLSAGGRTMIVNEDGWRAAWRAFEAGGGRSAG